MRKWKKEKEDKEKLKKAEAGIRSLSHGKDPAPGRKSALGILNSY
ncbi:hypothetical protein [uncultured Merdimonas sp.]